MSKKIVPYLIGFIIGGIIFGSIGTVLALTYKASDIVYSPSDTSWNVSTVGEAINSLALSKTSDNYSTTEQIVGTWIDGKPLYQKTINLSNVKLTASNSTSELIHGVQNIDEAFVKDFYYNFNGTWSKLSTGFIIGNDIYNVNIICGDKSIYVERHSSGMSFSLDSKADRMYLITIQYTKTTDQAPGQSN